MPNYLDNIDVIDSNGTTTNVLIQDRGTLALANQIANNLAAEITNRENADTALQQAITGAVNSIGDLTELDTATKTNIVSAINEVLSTLTSDIDDTKDEILARDCCIRPEDFGAVGDGVADDTVAVQACFNSGDRLRKKILMTGKYKLTSKVTINSNTCIEGLGVGEIIDGWNNTVVTPTKLDCSLIAGNNVHDISITGISFKGSGALSHYIQEYIIRMENSTDIHLEKCKFLNIPAVACVVLQACNRGIINNCIIYEYTRGGFMLQGGTSSSIISNCFIMNGNETTDPNRYPISLCSYEIEYTSDNPAPQAYNNKAIHNFIQDATPHWEAIDAHGGNNFIIDGNIMLGTATGISAFTATSRGFECYRVQVTNNIFVAGGASQSGISRGFAITANESIISNNVIINAGRYSTGDAYGLYIPEVCANSIISNNIFMSCGKYAIVTSSSLSNVKFSNNIINYVVPINNESYAFFFNNWASWGNVHIENNTFNGPIEKIVRAPSVKQNNYSAIIMRNNNYIALAPSFDNIANIAPDLATEADIASSASGAQGLVCRNYNAGVGHPSGFIFVATNPLQNAGSWRNLANIT